MLGKQKCKILKEIRQKIADENDIPYVTRDCRHQGDCRGTCPRCESELRYLEQQLEARRALGKRVTVAALCAGMVVGAVGCSPLGKKEAPLETDLSGAVAYEPGETPEPDETVLSGEVAWPEEEPETGEVLPPEDDCENLAESDLTGDVAYEPGAEDNG